MFLLGWIIIAAIIWRIYLKFSVKQNGCYTCLVGKTAIVTGANAGIGYVTALDFAQRGARVILACRNKDKAEDAQRKIIKATQNSNVVYKLVDFTSLESVRAFTNDINETEERIDILVNNAGAFLLGNQMTKDGIQITLQVNHVSGFLLTHLLIDKIKRSAPSRIVNVSAMAAKFAKLEIETINEFPRNSNQFMPESTMYSNSKLCNIFFTTVLSDKLSGTGVTVNTLHPGTIKTEIMRNATGILRIIITTILNCFCMNVEEGSQTTIYVATSQELNHKTGRLFENSKEIDLYDTAQDPVLARQVWEKSEEFAKLNANEKLKYSVVYF